MFGYCYGWLWDMYSRIWSIMATYLCLENLTAEYKYGIIWHAFLKYKSDFRYRIVLHVAECKCILHAADMRLSWFALLLAFNDS